MGQPQGQLEGSISKCSHSEYEEKGGNSLITSSEAVCFNIAPNFLETRISRSEISEYNNIVTT